MNGNFFFDAQNLAVGGHGDVNGTLAAFDRHLVDRFAVFDFFGGFDHFGFGELSFDRIDNPLRELIQGDLLLVGSRHQSRNERRLATHTATSAEP